MVRISGYQENIFVHYLFLGKYMIMEIAAIIFKWCGLIKEIEGKDDIKLFEIPRINKGHLSLEIS
jgi:hypothetical protein